MSLRLKPVAFEQAALVEAHQYRVKAARFQTGCFTYFQPIIPFLSRVRYGVQNGDCLAGKRAVSLGHLISLYI